MKTEFEEFANTHGLSLKNKDGSIPFSIYVSKLAWDAQQAKIDKLEHDLGNERCANRMLQHVLDKEVKS